MYALDLTGLSRPSHYWLTLKLDEYLLFGGLYNWMAQVFSLVLLEYMLLPAWHTV